MTRQLAKTAQDMKNGRKDFRENTTIAFPTSSSDLHELPFFPCVSWWFRWTNYLLSNCYSLHRGRIHMPRKIEEKNLRPERSSFSLSACLVTKRSLSPPARFKACVKVADHSCSNKCLFQNHYGNLRREAQGCESKTVCVWLWIPYRNKRPERNVLHLQKWGQILSFQTHNFIIKDQKWPK